MTDTNQPALEAETAATGLSDILEGQSSPAPVEQAPALAAPATETAPAGNPEAPNEEQNHPFWYRKRLKEVEQRARAAERRAEELAQRSEQPAPQQFNDPMEFFQHQQTVIRLDMSEGRFIDKHGEQEFEAVKEWLATRPDIEAWAIQQRHPWGQAYQQYQREKLSAEIGDDPNAWREQERAKLRAEIQAEFGGHQAPMTPRPNIPAPASGQRSAAPRNGPGWAGPKPLADILGR
ncbi:MAG TPA: hypothetical protein VLZ73_12695 [Brevundimonas sp.]|nr:hypothetical protein [Brevundimonas sp.]